MRKMGKTATTVAATGLAALACAGAMAATEGTAHAAQGQGITGCNLGSSMLVAGVAPACTASTGTIENPVSVTVSVPPDFFQTISSLPGIGAILQALGQPLAVNVTYSLVCRVNGVAVTSNKSFQADGSNASDSQTDILQDEVGSPAPNSCQVRNLTATSLLTLNSQILDLIPADQKLSFGVTATGDTADPGAIWASYPADANGARATVCVDDTGNGEAGVATQAYQCQGDLAEQWVHVGTHQLVHNGDCLTDKGGKVSIEACEANPGANSGQVWLPQHATGMGTLTNASDDGCLTAPTAGKIDGTPLTVRSCASGDAGQQWTLPATTPQ